MFWHNFKYSLLCISRNKSQMFWSLLFIIAMGTLFKVTFGDIFEKDEMFHEIPVAVYMEDEEVSGNFKQSIEEISLSEDGTRLLAVTYTETMEEAEQLLQEEEVRGVFFSEQGELKLLVSEQNVSQSILGSVVTQYHQTMTILSKMEGKSQEEFLAVMLALFSEENHNTELKTTEGNMDVYIQYFYNLIAMACLMSVITGSNITVLNRPDMTQIGARKNMSGVNPMTTGIAGVLAAVLVQFICACIGFGYLLLIGVKMGEQIGLMLLIMLLGVLTALSIGYFIGVLRISSKVKDGIGTFVSVGLCFMSGLMVADMRMIVEESCPFFNDINPAVLISDSFYALKVYDSHKRFWINMLTLLIISVAFLVLGGLFGRREKNADLSHSA